MRADQRRSLHRTILIAAVLLLSAFCRGRLDYVLRPGRRLPRARNMAPQHRDVLPCQALGSSVACRPFNQLFWSRRLIPGHLEPHWRQHKLL